MIFSYRAMNASGGIVTGTLEADNRSLLIDSLQNQNLTILEIKEDKDKAAAQKAAININLFQSVKINDLSLFTRQLSTMISAGLPIVRSLNILEDQTKNPMLRKAIADIHTNLEGGLALNECMARHPKIFSPMYVSMVAAGETGGTLDTILSRLADTLERDREINSKVKSASIYPIMILSVAVIVVVFILAFVMPVFVEQFTSSGAELPAFTAFFLGISYFIRAKGLWIFIALVIMVVSLKWVGSQPKGRRFFDLMYLKMPIIGKAVNRIAVSRFTRILGTLIRSGVPILEALEVLRGVVGNRVISDAIGEAKESIREGQTIAAPLAATGVFEPMVTQMIAVGEETGTLDEMLERMAVYYDNEVTFAIDALLKSLEPVMIIIVAVIVGSIIIAIYLPVFNIITTVV
ncbi:MAG TPA: type II secretion system F family protein [Syntrophomonadaceae bacterium]|nr:type II secretion system F family protein [Syntrophomonadaceae bacterium]